MPDAVQTKKICGPIADREARAECELAFELCGEIEGAGAAEYCRSQAGSCADQFLSGADSFTVVLPDNLVLTTGRAAVCSRAAVSAAGDFRPTSSSGDSSEPQAKTGEPAHDEKPADEGIDAQGDEDDELAAAKEQAGPWCEGIDKRDSAAVEACLGMFGICLEEGKGKFMIPMGDTFIETGSREVCIAIAEQLTGSTVAASVRKPSADSGTTHEKLPIESWKSDGKTTFDRRLIDTDFGIADMKVEGIKNGGAAKDLKLHIYRGWGRKTVQIRIAYRLKELAAGRYLMEYLIIGKNGAHLSKALSIEISEQNGRIVEDLAFGITLAREGDFTSVASVKIVNLSPEPAAQ